jgi:hypothetical protein
MAVHIFSLLALGWIGGNELNPAMVWSSPSESPTSCRAYPDALLVRSAPGSQCSWFAVLLVRNIGGTGDAVLCILQQAGG